MKKISKFFLLLILLVAGVGQTAKAADVVSDGNAYLYVKLNAVSWWLNGGTNGDHCFVYFYKGSSNQWSAHAIKIDDNHYAFKIPKGTWDGCILTRNNTTSSPSWNNKWNQTGDITLKSDNNYIKSFNENSTSVTWDTYQQTSTVSSTPDATEIDAGETVTFTSALTSNETYNVVKSTSYEISTGTEDTDWTINGDEITFLTANTYTVTATVTYNAKGFTDITNTETATASQITVNATSTYSLTVEAGEHVTEATGSVAEIEFDTPYDISATVADGYQFAGWSKTKGAGTVTFGDASLASTTTSVNGGSATVTSTASPITYSITYNVPAGATNPNTATSYTIESATITLQAASMTGKKFNGWFSEAEFTNKVTEIAQGSTGNKTLFASFSDLDLMYFINLPNWSSVNIYNWVGSTPEVNWPGSAMTKQDGKIWSGKNNYDYYSCYYKEAYPNCIFNGSSSQTHDQTGQANKYFLPSSQSSSKWNGNWVDVYALSYGKSEYGTLTLKSGSTTIAPAAGDKVVSGNSITFTATPDANCHIVGWFSDAEFTTPIPETGTETTYELTISAAASVYVQFAEDTDPSVTLALSANTIKVGESVTFIPTPYKVDGSETYTYYVNDSAIANATFTPETKGAYTCKVVMHYNDADYTSNVENLTVTGTCRLYYSNPEGWATVKAYLWENSDGNNYNAKWPGVEITANTKVINNRTYYYYEFDETKGWDRIIFNNCANSTATSPKTGDITFSVVNNDNQYNNAKASATGTWQNLPEPIDPETPYTTVKVLCDYNSNVKIFFLNKSGDFMVLDAEEDGNTSEYLMNAVGEGKQQIDGSEGYLYEVSFYGTSKMAIFVSSSHIGDNNKLTANDVDLTKAARVTYYFDLTGVVKGSPQSDTFSKIWVPLTQGYGTFCYPQAVQVSQAVPFWMQIQENMEEESGYELLMTAMEDNILPANTGALIYSKQKNAQAILTVVESTATYEDNDFLGTTERTAMPTNLGEGEKVYVLGNRTAGLAFYDYQPTSGYIPAYKAYFRLTPAAEPQGAPSRVKMTFRTEPSTPTGVEQVAGGRLQVAGAAKCMVNGKLIIIRDGKQFNAQGQEL